MLFIAHRGNINGPNPEKENNPDYIKEALSLGYDVEVDVWDVRGGLMLGHDSPQYSIPFSFLENKHLWIHCKTVETLSRLVIYPINCFFHNVDDVVLTSKGYLWTYPGKPLYGNSVCVLPELFPEQIIPNIVGICSDFVTRYQ